MGDWLADLMSGNLATALAWTALALVLLVVLLVLARIVRRLTSGTFVAGGRGRLPRLAVVDAAAVDNQRRLVLVRRDNVEHLILIGGPSDLVIEQGIPMREAEEPALRRREPPAMAARPMPAARPRPVPPQAPAQPAPALHPQEAAKEPPRKAEPQSGNAPGEADPLRKIDRSLEALKSTVPVKEDKREAGDESIENEMSRLLDDISQERQKGAKRG